MPEILLSRAIVVNLSDEFANGKICYMEIPATDIARSADFYKRAFGWNIRCRGDGSTALDDTVGEVSGYWVLGRPPASAPGLHGLHHGRQRGRDG
jgi:predicted enzyme related to lactoylglutathione lyase